MHNGAEGVFTLLELPPLHLAAQGFGKFVHELSDLGYLCADIRSRDQALAGAATRLEHDQCLDLFAAVGILLSDHACFGDGAMLMFSTSAGQTLKPDALIIRFSRSAMKKSLSSLR